LNSSFIAKHGLNEDGRPVQVSPGDSSFLTVAMLEEAIQSDTNWFSKPRREFLKFAMTALSQEAVKGANLSWYPDKVEERKHDLRYADQRDQHGQIVYL
jgi:hypothetical protein